MKHLLFLVLSVVITMSGCSSGVSKEEYEMLQSERDAANQKYVQLEGKFKELSDANSQLQKEKEEIEAKYQEYFDKYANLLAKTSISEYIGAWGKTVYGENIQYTQLGNNTVQLNVLEENITQDSILNFYNKLKENASTLALMTNNADYVYVRLLNADYAPVLEFFINQSDKDNLLITSSIGYEYFNIVSETLNTLIQ